MTEHWQAAFFDYSTSSFSDLLRHTAHVHMGKTYAGLHMPAFSARPYPSVARKIRDRCRSQFAMSRAHVERKIAQFVRNT